LVPLELEQVEGVEDHLAVMGAAVELVEDREVVAVAQPAQEPARRRQGESRLQHLQRRLLDESVDYTRNPEPTWPHWPG
jgi:hypothetical protein